LKLYAELLFVFFYPLIILFFVISIQIGVLGWLVIALFLAPPTALWYYVMKKRVTNYLRLLMAKPRPWDIKKAIEEYVELQKKQKS